MCIVQVTLGYIVLELTTACLFFIILPVLWGTVTGVVIKVCACWLWGDKVVDGPHGW